MDRVTAMDFATLAKMIVTDLKKDRQSQVLRKYSKKQVMDFLENPQKYEKQLREISNIIYNKSPHYRRLVNYFAKLPVFSYIVEPFGIDVTKTNKKKFLNQYNAVLNLLDIMNIRHELQKVLTLAFKEDIFYGYEHMTKDNYFIQRLNSDYCRISSVEDGVYNFAFDFSFFDTNQDKLIMFPKEFKSNYEKYKATKTKWIELDSKNTICIKINEETEYPIIPFAGLFDAIFEIEEFKSLRKTKEEIGNYKVLIQQLPMRQDSEQNNDFTIDFNHMTLFHNKAAEALPENVGLITSPMEIKDISFNKDRIDNDNVANAERDFWSGSGVSQLLFNAEKAGSIGLDKSIKTDEQIIFGVIRQVERWLNRKLKFTFSNPLFKVNLLDLTVFNVGEVFERALKAAQFGFPVKSIVGATLGLSPSALINMTFLENEVLGLPDMFNAGILASSHTAGAEPNDKGGRPQQGDKVSEEGLRTRDTKKPI